MPSSLKPKNSSKRSPASVGGRSKKPRNKSKRVSSTADASICANRTVTEADSNRGKKKGEASSKKSVLPMPAAAKAKQSAEVVRKGFANVNNNNSQRKSAEATKKGSGSLKKKQGVKKSQRINNQDKQQASKACPSKTKKKSVRGRNVDKQPATSAQPSENKTEEKPTKTELRMPSSKRLAVNSQMTAVSAQTTKTPPESKMTTAPTTKTQASQMTAVPASKMTRPLEKQPVTRQITGEQTEEQSQADATVERSLIPFPGSFETVVNKALDQKTMGAEGRRAMEEFREYILAQDWKKVSNEYEQISKIRAIGVIPQQEMKTAFYPEIPCLDCNKILTMDLSSLYHASRFIMAAKPGVSDLRFVLAQAPPTSDTPTSDKSVEDFWFTLFHEEPSLMILLAPVYEDGKGSNFFPLTAGDYITYGKIMVTTKRVESLKYGTSYVFEVLPEGCSNATFVKMIHCEHWAARTTPNLRGFLPLIEQCREADLGPNTTTTIMLVSRKGIGRPAVLATACVVYNRLLQGHFTPVFNVAINLRNQRASAFENLAQYGFIYLGLAGYIKKYASQEESSRWGEAMNHIGQWLPGLAKSWDTNC